MGCRRCSHCYNHRSVLGSCCLFHLLYEEVFLSPCQTQRFQSRMGKHLQTPQTRSSSCLTVFYHCHRIDHLRESSHPFWYPSRSRRCPGRIWSRCQIQRLHDDSFHRLRNCSSFLSWTKSRRKRCRTHQARIQRQYASCPYYVYCLWRNLCPLFYQWCICIYLPFSFLHQWQSPFLCKSIYVSWCILLHLLRFSHYLQKHPAGTWKTDLSVLKRHCRTHRPFLYQWTDA